MEYIILENLFRNPSFFKKVLPHVKVDYFEEAHEKEIFTEIDRYANNYKKQPSPREIAVQLKEKTGLTEDTFKRAVQELREISTETSPIPDEQWLLDNTEKFCKDKAVYNTIVKSLDIINGTDKKHNPEAIPDLMKEALAVSFDTRVGHDFLMNAAERWDYLHRKENRFTTGITELDELMGGGWRPKTINIWLAVSNAGKSMTMINNSIALLKEGKNVLYITLEMSEEETANRADANLLDIDLNDLKTLPREDYIRLFEYATKEFSSSFKIREYPTGSAHAGHFRALLHDLKLKQNFVPDVVFVDYLNICASSRLKAGGNVNSYNLISAIAQELRGLAQEFNFPLVTATQSNRSGFGSSDIDMTNVADSAGTIFIADWLGALIRTEELDETNQLVIKELKSRYGDVASSKKMYVNVNRSRQKLFSAKDHSGKMDVKPNMRPEYSRASKPEMPAPWEDDDSQVSKIGHTGLAKLNEQVESIDAIIKRSADKKWANEFNFEETYE